MTSPTAAPEMIQKLVETFEQNLDSYRSSKNETELRLEFLDKFFTALGWDVANEKCYDEAGKEVVHEFSVDVAGKQKKADYAFRVGRGDKFDFLVEAKKPAVKIDTSQEAAFQIRRYGWSAKLPINILTDFEQFAVYDCRAKPSIHDKASQGRIMLIHYKEYVERWHEIAEIFSPEAVRKGSFAKYAEGTKGKKGTADVDDAFLEEIERWRELLAKNIALRNQAIDIASLNYAVQMTIDRIVFLRICEERGIEPEGQLQRIAGYHGVYSELCSLFKQADTKYNSGLFHFKSEKGQSSQPDDLTLTLAIDDKVLKDIILNLYYPKSPYAFLYIPSDILGQVYERFLGKVIRLTAGHQAKVEEKPEVRKAGGVYYTPTYIVDYIVKNTVGKLVENKKPKDAAALKIVDPACGSGTFLLGAYQFLLDWHLNWYIENEPEKALKTKAIEKAGEGYRLTTAKKKEILLNNIHGVDIDAQAVEVTKLSLLLKVLENASGQLELGMERVLPDLGNNIKCGNSLIGYDYFAGQLMPDPAETARINPFDWKREFPQVFQQTSEVSETSEVSQRGGFDAVIGNPPYLYSAGKDDLGYFTKRYRLLQFQTDYYVYFIEQAIFITKKGGMVSFIVSDSWLNSDYFSKVRNHLLTEQRIERITVFDYPVFTEAALENSIFLITKQGCPERFPIERFSSPTSFVKVNEIEPKDALERGMIDPRQSEGASRVIEHMEKDSQHLEKYVRINRGVHAYRTDGYGKTKFGGGYQTKKDKDLHSYHSEIPLDGTYLPELKGKNVFRFYYESTGMYLSYGNWLAEPREPVFFFSPKITLRKILGPKLHGTLIIEPTVLDQSLYVIVSEDNDIALLKYILGVLLSRLGAWYIRTKYSIYDMLYPWYTKKQLASFPLKVINNELVALIDQMFALNKNLSVAKTPQEKERMKRQIEATDKAIDALVYQLYGLSEEEIKIVEGGL